jgi:hypothetical protein
VPPSDRARARTPSEEALGRTRVYDSVLASFVGARQRKKFCTAHTLPEAVV